MSEQLVPLTQEDRQVLKRKRKFFLIWGGGLLTVGLLLLSVLLVVHTFAWLVMLLCGGVGLALMSLVPLYIQRLFSKDLRDSQKRLISGPVEAQNVDVTRPKDKDGIEGDAVYRFWIQIGGKKITVTEDQYYQFKTGDLATAFLAPYSQTVLGVHKESLRPFS
jgi:hypothetical protein